MDEYIKIIDLQYLALQFALPCIIRDKEITIIGQNNDLIFKCEEKKKCQLKKIIYCHQ